MVNTTPLKSLNSLIAQSIKKTNEQNRGFTFCKFPQTLKFDSDKKQQSLQPGKLLGPSSRTLFSKMSSQHDKAQSVLSNSSMDLPHDKHQLSTFHKHSSQQLKKTSEVSEMCSSSQNTITEKTKSMSTFNKEEMTKVQRPFQLSSSNNQEKFKHTLQLIR